VVGNDIVDLADPDASRGACHPRFDRRVFAPDEARSLPTECSDLQKRWILWSAKEAAFKAARRESARVVFSPARFVVDLDRSLCGSVRHEMRRWSARVRVDGDCVHAVVGDSNVISSIVSSVCRLTIDELRDPSAAVRRFTLSSLAAMLRVATSDLRIERAGRIPQLILAGRARPVPLSLSHHGSYAGFACSDPRGEADEQVSERIVTGEFASTGLLSSLEDRCEVAAERIHFPQGGVR